MVDRCRYCRRLDAITIEGLAGANNSHLGGKGGLTGTPWLNRCRRKGLGSRPGGWELSLRRSRERNRSGKIMAQEPRHNSLDYGKQDWTPA
jgi:hypothetical protein